MEKGLLYVLFGIFAVIGVLRLIGKPRKRKTTFSDQDIENSEKLMRDYYK